MKELDMQNEPTPRETSLHTQIALGWVTMLLVLCWTFAIAICESAMASTNFRDLLKDPGLEGMPSLKYIGAVYGLMPIYLNVVSKFRMRIFRWIAVVGAAFVTISWILHHLSHVVDHTRTTLASNMPDLTLDALGLWVLINSILWARSPRVPE